MKAILLVIIFASSFSFADRGTIEEHVEHLENKDLTNHTHKMEETKLIKPESRNSDEPKKNLMKFAVVQICGFSGFAAFTVFVVSATKLHVQFDP